MTFEEAIISLGTEPEQVTAKLREKSIKGYRRMASNCPISNYLKSCGFSMVYVSNIAGAQLDSGEEVQVLLPPGIRQWVRDFDDGCYSEFRLETSHS
jgi:hypothetical protein